MNFPLVNTLSWNIKTPGMDENSHWQVILVLIFPFEKIIFGEIEADCRSILLVNTPPFQAVCISLKRVLSTILLSL